MDILQSKSRHVDKCKPSRASLAVNDCAWFDDIHCLPTSDSYMCGVCDVTANQSYVSHISDDHRSVLTHVVYSRGEDQCREGWDFQTGIVKIVSQRVTAIASSDIS